MGMEVLRLFSLRLAKRNLNCLAASLDRKVVEQWFYTFFWKYCTWCNDSCRPLGSPGGISRFQTGAQSKSVFLLCFSAWFPVAAALELVLHSLFLLGMSSLQSSPRLLTMETLAQILARAAGPHVSLPVCHSDILGHIPRPELLFTALPVNYRSCLSLWAPRGLWKTREDLPAT